MAQNIIKKYPTDAEFHNSIRQPLETFRDVHARLERMAAFLNSADAADYPNSPLTDLGSLRTRINAFLDATETITFRSEIENFVRI